MKTISLYILGTLLLASTSYASTLICSGGLYVNKIAAYHVTYTLPLPDVPPPNTNQILNGKSTDESAIAPYVVAASSYHGTLSAISITDTSTGVTATSMPDTTGAQEPSSELTCPIVMLTQSKGNFLISCEITKANLPASPKPAK